QALRLLDRLPQARWVKVGPGLMTGEGPEFIRELTGRGLQVFLDLKWHDIPNTVAGAVAAARDLSVAMATVHTLGGSAMLSAAVMAGGRRLALVGVTVLTSHDATSYAAAVGRDAVDLATEVERQAAVAVGSGLRGVVCSTQEASAVRRRLGPASWIVVPGIRRPADGVGDQVRTATPEQAVRAGATHLVVGRPLIQAAEPGGVFRELMEAVA
ncbi:MAG: orotidine-5'-phosphate decarboxylase, partial [Gemmatimonadales bacterium]